MTNKKTNYTQKSSVNSFDFTMGLLGIVAVIFFPITIIGLVLFALFGEGSARGGFWESVGPTRAENYANPYVKKDERR